MIIFDKQFFIRSFERMAQLAETKRDYWTELDSAIGDGDHGINLSIGFREVATQLPILAENGEDLEKLFKKIGMILLGKVGGASGPLYGSFFMKMGAGLKDQHTVDFDTFVHMINQGVEAISSRGKATVGEKTMLDSLVPGLKILSSEDSQKKDSVILMAEAIETMKKGSQSTKELIAKKGRAMKLGERSVGHLDPGAESSWMLMNCFYEEMKAM